jgi:amino acid adenylation domain-containing protein
VSIAEFVSHLRNLDVRLSAEGERLRVNAPKGVLTDNLRSEIAERKQELLQFLSDHDQPSAFDPPPIPRRTSKESAPLSFAQERLWFLEQLESGSAVYNICRASRLTGQLNIAALEASFTEILRRHEILRSEILIVDGRPVQGAVAVLRFEMPVIDLRSFTETECEQEMRDRIKAEAEWQFDFSAGLFLRAVLLQISNDQHILILTTHHIVADAWSMGILTLELWTLYDALANERPSPLQELAVQYADYAVWQREWLQGYVLESQLSYWKEQLKEPPILNLASDYPRPVKQSFRGARQPLSLPESLTAAVNELSRREGVTQFMTLLAAFQVLLCRYSGQEDIVVGSPIANRNRTETEGLIGFFVNTLVLRADVSGKPSLRELLQRVRDVCLGAYTHQDLPFEKLVEELRPDRDLSRNPLFQVMFVLQNTPRPLPQPAGLSIERVDVQLATSPFDLSLYLRERDGKFIGFIEYNTDLFESSTIERMVGHFETLLKGIIAAPKQPISKLPLLTEAERHQLLVEWNATEADYPTDSCIHELFEAQVERTPEAIAVQFEGKVLTYRELNSRANQLAHYLRELGIGPEKLVGICVERSLEMVVGLLGILKVGGAYVPLDPAYPRERLEFMLQDAQVSILLTQEKLVEDRGWRPVLSPSTMLRIDSTEGIDDSNPRSSIFQPQLVCLDLDWEKIAQQSEENLEKRATAQNLAYVIYTSGSTGQPKGVAIEHRNTIAFLHWARSVFTPEELSGVLASTSICFDLSIFELFVPLSWGGKVILVENVLQLPSGSGRHQVTLINTVPSAMTELLRINGLPESLRTVNLAGEPLRSDLVEQIYDGGNVNKVYDLYGPSETTTYSTFTLRASNQPATIGRPIANSRIYILDGSLEPVPVGVTGEIFIGGAGVARGYLNRSELTADMFIADPFRGGQGGRLYRTGDRGRYLPDGNIEFIGRTDNQVKIRGYRIELGEIDAVLNQHPAVKDAVVAVREEVREEEYRGDNPKSKLSPRLVAYVVPNEEQPSINELRGVLKKTLPEYMIPSSFVVLEALPLMPNGKVDRNTLPLPDGTRPPLTGQFASPRTEIEELIALTWQEVLKIEDVGIYDNFFELGGHSLLATQIVARLQEAFNKDVPLRVLFDAPTIAELAREVETIIRDGRAPELPPIVPVPRDRPIPLSMNQEHLWHLDRMMPGTHFFNMPYVYQLSGDLNVNALESALSELIGRYEALRTIFGDVDGRPVQIIKEPVKFELPIIDLADQVEGQLVEKAADFVLEERQRSFNLSLGPLFRIKLLRLTYRDWLLLVTIHHIISDYWSMQIFRDELIALYDAFAKGSPPALPKPAIQFADYAIWEKHLVETGHLDSQLSYWKRRLACPVLYGTGLNDGKRRRAASVPTIRRSLEIGEDLFAGIKTVARSNNCTPFIVVFTVLSIVLHKWSGEEDIRIGTLVANRAQGKTENVIGHFLNTVVLRIEVSSKMSFGELLSQVRRVTLAAHVNENLPFEHLARVLEQEHKAARDFLFPILMSYQMSNCEPLERSGLTFASLDIDQLETVDKSVPTAFDLIFKLRESSTNLTGTVNYVDDRFDTSDVVSILDCFESALKSIAIDPNHAMARKFSGKVS